VTGRLGKNLPKFVEKLPKQLPNQEMQKSWAFKKVAKMA
jgi:hypothetical protein